MTENNQHYKGHRQRVYAKFINDLGESFADYELLEMLYFFSIPMKDTKPLAKSSIDYFNGIENVFAASIAELKNAKIPPCSWMLIKLVNALCKRISWKRLREQDRPILSSLDLLHDYCRTAMSHATVEEFRVIFLDSSLRIIKEKVMQRGTVNEVAVHPREVVRETLDCQANSIIMMHNHPGGKASPSAQDRKVTKEIVEALNSLEIAVYDHLIFTADDYYSFRDSGLLTK